VVASVLRRVMRDTRPPGDLQQSEARIAADEYALPCRSILI